MPHGVVRAAQQDLGLRQPQANDARIGRLAEAALERRDKVVALHAALGRKAVDRQRLRVVQIDEVLHRPQCVGGLLLRLCGARLRAAAAFDQLRDDEGRQTAQVRLVAPPVKFLLKQEQEAAQPI